MRKFANLIAVLVPLLGVALPLIALAMCSGIASESNNAVLCQLPIPGFSALQVFSLAMVVLTFVTFGLAPIVYVLSLVLVGFISRYIILQIGKKTLFRNGRVSRSQVK